MQKYFGYSSKVSPLVLMMALASRYRQSTSLTIVWVGLCIRNYAPKAATKSSRQCITTTRCAQQGIQRMKATASTREVTNRTRASMILNKVSILVSQITATEFHSSRIQNTKIRSVDQSLLALGIKIDRRMITLKINRNRVKESKLTFISKRKWGTKVTFPELLWRKGGRHHRMCLFRL